MTPYLEPPVNRLARIVTLLLLALAPLPARADGVRILQAPGLGLLPDIQTAIDAAADGDVLIVAPGAYAPFVVDDRSIWIVAMEPGSVSISGTVLVSGTTNKDVVVMIGIEALGLAQDFQSDPGLNLSANNGRLRFQQCRFTGGKGTLADTSMGAGEPTRGDGGHGVFAYDNKRVTFVDCTLEGGVGGGKDSLNYEDEGGDGGHGVHAELSTVVVYDSAVTGGEGGVGGSWGGKGGNGYHAADFGVVAVGCDLSGGDGGYTWDFLCCTGGSGGDAVFVDTTAQAQLTDNFYLRGNPGGACCGVPVGAFGKLKNGDGVIVEHPVPARTFTASHIASDGALWKVEAAVEPGDVAFFYGSRRPVFQVPFPVWGVFLTPLPTMPIAYPGALFGKPFGAPKLSPTLGDLTAFDQLPMFWQGAVRQSGQLQPCSPVHVLVFDRAGSPDCDGDGVNDWLALHEGLVVDCNQNLAPDTCDLASATSADCNLNGVPDECDIAAGTSPDANSNGLPDECEGMGVIWHVDDDALPGGDGSFANPFQDIGDALAVSLTGDTVLVQDGTYTGAGNREMDFAGRDVLVKSANGAASCVIDLQQLGHAFEFLSGETSGARLEGFTIRNGDSTLTGPIGGRGGAIIIQGAGPVIADCTFEDCRSPAGGGAIYAGGTGATRITGCTFTGNQAFASRGGAISGSGQPRFIDHCRFENNATVQVGSTVGDGGAVEVSAFSGRPIAISHCEFINNASSSRGGGLDFFSDSEPLSIISECLFMGNTAANEGGAMVVVGSQTGLSGLTIVDNSAVNAGGGIVIDFGVLALSNSVLWGNTAPTGSQIALVGSFSISVILSVDYSLVEFGEPGVFIGPDEVLDWGAGNLSSDPLFVLPGSDYRLGLGSPAIDAGHGGLVAPDQLDLDGDGNTTEATPFDLDSNPRFFDDPLVPNTGHVPNPFVDLGAYEGQG